MARIINHGRPVKLGMPEIPDFSTNYNGAMITDVPASKPVLPPVPRSASSAAQAGTRTARQPPAAPKPKQSAQQLQLASTRRRSEELAPGRELGTEYAAISGADLERIRKDAARSDGKTQKMMFEEEKKRLHELSQLRVEKWSNTILGQRRARIKAVELKKQRAEEEKLRVDREWAETRARERDEAVAKARQKQYAAEPRVRKLHSQLLISNVLAERHLQIALISKRRQELDRQDREEASAAVSEDNPSAFSQMHQRSTDAKERSKRIKMECAVVQLQQIEHKKHQSAVAKQADRNFYKAAGRILVGDYMRGAADQAQLKTARAEAFKKDVGELAAAKKNQQVRVREFDEAQQRDIAAFLAGKEKREVLKKAVIDQRLKERERMIERLGQQTAEERKANEEIKSRYIRETEVAAQSRREQEAAAWEQRRARAMEEIEAHRKEQIEHAEKQRRLAEQEQHADRQRIEQQKKEADEEEDRLTAERREQEAAVKDFQKQQIDENARRREAERALELAAQLDALKALEIDDEEFVAYAEKLIRDWHEAGRDVGPLMRALQGANRKRVYEFHRILNTYDRLGLHLF